MLSVRKTGQRRLQIPQPPWAVWTRLLSLLFSSFSSPCLPTSVFPGPRIPPADFELQGSRPLRRQASVFNAILRRMYASRLGRDYYTVFRSVVVFFSCDFSFSLHCHVIRSFHRIVSCEEFDVRQSSKFSQFKFVQLKIRQWELLPSGYDAWRKFLSNRWLLPLITRGARLTVSRETKNYSMRSY